MKSQIYSRLLVAFPQSVLLAGFFILTGVCASFAQDAEENAVPLKLISYPNRMQNLSTLPFPRAKDPALSPQGPLEPTASLTAPTVYSALTGVTALRIDAAVGSSSGTDYVLSNLRITSDQTVFDDYLIGSYSFDLATQRLQPVSFLKYSGVGIFESGNNFFLKDNTSTLYFYTSPTNVTQYPEGPAYTFQGGSEYLVNTSVGHCIDMVFTGIANRTVRISLIDTHGEVVFDQKITFPSSTFFGVQTHVPVFLDGPYRFRMETVSPTTAFTYSCIFFNSNGTNVTTAINGTTLSASLPGYGLRYKKYKVRLASGQSMTAPLDSDTELTVINSKGVIVAGPTNAGINVTVTETDDYYIVIQPGDSVSSSTENYSGRLTITTALSFADWAISHRLHPDRDGPSEDANRDGIPNLLPYALGTNPLKSAPLPVAFAANATTMTLTFPAASYATNVLYQPEFSTTLSGWSPATPINSGSVEGATIKTASFARSGGSGFGHLKLTLSP